MNCVCFLAVCIEFLMGLLRVSAADAGKETGTGGEYLHRFFVSWLRTSCSDKRA